MLFRSVQLARESEHRKHERLAAIGTMAAAVAHEIRNPLASISGAVQMLEDSARSDSERSLMAIVVRETHAHSRHEATHHAGGTGTHHDGLSTGRIFLLTSFRDRALSSCSQAGMVNNLNDGLAWGLFPIFFADAGLSVGRIGILAALYPAAWGLGLRGAHRISQSTHTGRHRAETRLLATVTAGTIVVALAALVISI